MKKKDVLERAQPHYSENEVLELDHAIDYATKLHYGQKRKSGEPYISHPLAVAATLIEWGMDIDSVIAGVLHDTIEDTAATIESIESLFGADVAFLVDGVTKVGMARSGMQNLENYLPQTRDNLSKLLIAVGQDVRVIIIKLADRLHNMQTLQYKSKSKQKKIARETLDVFAPMADRLGMGRLRMQLEELAFSYIDPARFQYLQNQMRKRLGKSTRKLGAVRQEVEKELARQNIKASINGRVKSIYSLHKKLAKKNQNMDDIYDLMALRIIVDTKEDCYRVLGLLHTLYQPMITRIKDYIATPKPNGYQSLHTTVVARNEQIVEFQIRTEQMHAYAESGLAASFHYHENKDSKTYLRQKKTLAMLPSHLQWITQLQDVASRLHKGDEISHDQLSIDLFADRIFVYSPKGDIYNLPEGSLPLDFAYLVHSDVAKHASGVRVNGNISSFDKPLSNGDIIEIITRRNASPKEGWFELITTSHSRAKLRQQLKRDGIIDKISNAAAIIRRKKKQESSKR